jgi:hypothetical protein
MTLLSLANIVGSDKDFIVEARSFMQVMKGPKTDPCGTQYVTVPQLEKKFGAALEFLISTFCFPFARYDLTQFAAVP